MGERYPQGMGFKALAVEVYKPTQEEAAESLGMNVLKEDDGLQGHPQAIIQKILRKAQGY